MRRMPEAHWKRRKSENEPQQVHILGRKTVVLSWRSQTCKDKDLSSDTRHPDKSHLCSCASGTLVQGDRDRISGAHWAVNRRAQGSLRNPVSKKMIWRELVDNTHRPHPASTGSLHSHSHLYLIFYKKSTPS